MNRSVLPFASIKGLIRRASNWLRGETYRPEYLIASEPLLWDTDEARLWRYYFWKHYLNNTIYSTTNRYASELKKKNKLYKHIKPLKNPTRRLVNLYVAKTYGGFIDYETGRQGATPLIGDDAIVAACLQLFRWSNWQIGKSLYVRAGAAFGDAAIKVIDDRTRQKVYFENLPAEYLRDVEFDSRGNVIRATICYDAYEPIDPNAKGITLQKPYLYEEIITPEKFYTLKDGEPFAYYQDLSGKPIAEWDNEAGFVPIAITHHAQASGQRWGESAMHGVYDKVDQLNNVVSYMLDQAKKDITPLLLGKKITDITPKNLTDRDDIVNILMSSDADAKIEAVRTNLDIPAAIQLAQYLEQEIEADLPELALHRMRGLTNPTAPGISAIYSDAVEKFTEAQGIYDHGTIRALKMGITIGALNKYKGFAGISPQAYERGDLDNLFIAARPVINDTLTKKETEELNLKKADTADKLGLATKVTILKAINLPGVEDAEEEVAAADQEAEARAQRMQDQMEADITRLANMPDAPPVAAEAA